MGDPVCWLDQTCPDCGAMLPDTGAAPCPRCGLSAPRPGATPEQVRRTWAGNRTYRAGALRQPDSVDELRELVASSAKIHALGSRHSFNAVADSPGTQVNLDHLEPTVTVDADARTATVSAWATYGDVAPTIHDHGLALATLASLPHISVAGACATATHGSGAAIRNLSAAVSAMTFVDGRGELVEVNRTDDPDTFPGQVVHLGAIGVVVSITLDLVPAVPVHQRAWVGLPGSVLRDHVDEVMAGADSVSCFTRWRDDTIDIVLHKSTGDPDDDPADILGAPRATETRHPIPGLDPASMTRQLGEPGPWYDRLPHFRLDHVPSAGAEVQSEWFVDRADAAAAMDAMWAVGPDLADALQTSELRTIASDDLWLSPASERDVLALHFTWVRDPDLVHSAVDVVEGALAPFDPVPHWGKVSHADRQVFVDRYDRLDAFAALAERHDPEHRFRNAFLDDLLG